MAEKVRLVIWDLDETFWKGTVTEGGIKEYVQANHDLVITLAERGIISSICSKNDASTILPILKEHGIADYFVFPSISWETKGPRLAQIIEDMHLRPETVMFIDDNPNNRAEAAAVVTGLQVESEAFIPAMLADPRFAGKDDRELSRLKQYRLLEERHAQQEKAGGNNDDFLRSSDIRVYIEYDVESHIDRAVELINRTNQLNFTKLRLPEQPEAARQLLRQMMAPFNVQAGLVHVMDKYGDYGFVGFFLVNNLVSRDESGPKRNLVHYCFSCRTLGMLVEKWLFDYLGRPTLKVSGDVVTDLYAPKHVDWVSLASQTRTEEALNEQIAPEIRFWGGCETDALGTYFRPHAAKSQITCNFNFRTLFVRLNSVYSVFGARTSATREFQQEANNLRLPFKLLTPDYFRDSPPGTLFLFNGGADARPHMYRRYRHKHYGWELILEPLPTFDVDFSVETDETVVAKIARSPFVRNPPIAEELRNIAAHIRENYRRVVRNDMADIMNRMRAMIESLPEGGKLIILIDDPRSRDENNVVTTSDNVNVYARHMQVLAAEYPYVETVWFRDSIESDREIHIGGNHMDRIVYWRISHEIKAKARAMPGKPAISASAIMEEKRFA